MGEIWGNQNHVKINALNFHALSPSPTLLQFLSNSYCYFFKVKYDTCYHFCFQFSCTVEWEIPLPLFVDYMLEWINMIHACILKSVLLNFCFRCTRSIAISNKTI